MGSVKGWVGQEQLGSGQWACTALFSVALLFWGATASAQLAASVPELVSVNRGGRAGNLASVAPAVSTDGRFVAFYSDASDLVVGDTNGARDVFVHDRALRRTERVSVSETGAQANDASHRSGDHPAISGDGNVVAFDSEATNLVAGDSNGVSDVFVRLRAEGITERVSVSSGGAQANGPSTSPTTDATGDLVAFQSLASNLVSGDTNGVADIFLRHRSRGTTERPCTAVEPNGPSSQPALSANGRFLAFVSAATNLVPGDTNGVLDVFVCDRETGRLELVSRSSTGELGNGDSILPAISADGRVVVFKSLASNLVSNDRNGLVDVFVHDRATRQTQRASVSFLGGDSNAVSYAPAVDCSGRFVAFGSEATNLVVGDFNQVPSLFVRDLNSQRTFLVDRNAAGEQANGGVLDVAPSVSCQPLLAAYTSLASNLVVNDENELADVYIQSELLPTCRTDADCQDNDLCTVERCGDDGICVYTPKVCEPLDTCHEAGTCDPTTGECSSPPKPDGSTCDDGNACTTDDRCVGGSCTGAAVECTGADGCHDAGTCDPDTGLCPNPRPDGTVCDDGNLCTENDQCVRSRCQGTAIDCSQADGCHDAGTCDPATGLCPNPRPDGTVCDDGNLCTRSDACDRGRCRGTPVDCSSTDGCHDVGICDPATGLCPNPRPDGTPCSDANLCTINDHCVDGVCVGVAKDCSDTAGGCHGIGPCDPRTGQCPNQLPDGTPCSTGAFCVVGEVCINGNCTGGNNRNCDNGLFCDGVELCDESRDLCVSSGSPCSVNEVCLEEQRTCAAPTATPSEGVTPAPTATPSEGLTPPPTATATNIVSPTATALGPLDRDSCSCNVTPQSRTAGLLWASGAAAFCWRYRRRRPAATRRLRDVP